MRIICTASPARPLLRFAALAQPGMINDNIVAELDALWTPPEAGGPLVTRESAPRFCAARHHARAEPPRHAASAHSPRSRFSRPADPAGRYSSPPLPPACHP